MTGTNSPQQNMKTFQEYIEEVEGYYNDIKQQIIDLVPTLQEKLDKNPNNRLLVYSLIF